MNNNSNNIVVVLRKSFGKAAGYDLTHPYLNLFKSSVENVGGRVSAMPEFMKDAAYKLEMDAQYRPSEFEKTISRLGAQFTRSAAGFIEKKAQDGLVVFMIDAPDEKTAQDVVEALKNDPVRQCVETAIYRGQAFIKPERK